MGHWTVREGDVTCGYDGCAIPAGEPVYAMPGTFPRYRCQTHAPRPINQAEIAEAQQAIANRTREQFHRVLSKDAGIRGVMTPAGPKPFHEVSDDPVIARLCAEGDR